MLQLIGDSGTNDSSNLRVSARSNDAVVVVVVVVCVCVSVHLLHVVASTASVAPTNQWRLSGQTSRQRTICFVACGGGASGVRGDGQSLPLTTVRRYGCCSKCLKQLTEIIITIHISMVVRHGSHKLAN